MEQIEKLLKKLNTQEKEGIETAIKNTKDSYKDAKEKLEFALSLRGQKKDKDFFSKASKLLCWNSISYCCRSGKEGKTCLWRDTFLKLVGISQEEYEKGKKKFDEEFK